MTDFQRADTWPDNLKSGNPLTGAEEPRSVIIQVLHTMGLKMNRHPKKPIQKLKQLGGGRRSNLSELGFYKAMALKKLGNEDEAKSILERIENDANRQLKSTEDLDYFSKFGSASTRESRMAESYYQMGLAEYGLGDKAKARENFAKAIELNQNHIWAKLMLESKIFKD